MTLLIYYIVICSVMNAVVIAACLALERVLPWASMPIFLTLFFISLWLAWIVSVKLTEPKKRSAPVSGAPSDQRA
jgi:hypothetical protein